VTRKSSRSIVILIFLKWLAPGRKGVGIKKNRTGDGGKKTIGERGNLSFVGTNNQTARLV